MAKSLSQAPLPPVRRQSRRRLAALTQIFLQEDINFLLTNRIPRRYATLFIGWLSKIENRPLAALTIFIWETFAGDLRLDEAKERRFKSLQACFTRELRAGARPIDPNPNLLVSPCDAIIGAFGRIEGTRLFQIKGLPYSLEELLGDSDGVARHRDGQFLTLRLKSSMYHRFHAPSDCRVNQVRYITGDTWNVNPIALKRVERLFCRNERAVIDLTLPDPSCRLSLIPVAAILVAGIKLHFIDQLFDLRYRGKTVYPCNAAFRKGDELGYFQSGSTLLVLASANFTFCRNVVEGEVIRFGQPLLECTPTHSEMRLE